MINAAFYVDLLTLFEPVSFFYSCFHNSVCNLNNPLLLFVLMSQLHMYFFSLLFLFLSAVLTALFFCFPLTENNKAPLQRSRSRQNINAGSAAVKAPPAKEAHNESEGQPSAARSKAAACSESGRQYRRTPGQNYCLDRERVVERETVRLTVKETEAEAEPPACQPSPTVAPVSSCSTNGESDVEALLAKLRAL